jgi:hypothetical protein
MKIHCLLLVHVVVLLKVFIVDPSNPRFDVSFVVPLLLILIVKKGLVKE